ncbi:MAG: 3-hydroxybutyryl-CoA dehydratase [Bacteroidetes bacterium]|nr:3-hydroxybutyryl-CoA dehydratase [Bacteroidota bacterium]
MELQTLLVEIRDAVALVTINRPEKLNALNAVAKRELREVMSMLRDNPAVAVVVLTGAGEKAFVAGTDIEELTSLETQTGEAFSREGQAVLDLIETLGKPVIAAVNGYALGGGCELAMACTLRIASDRARFGQPEVNLGVIPGYGGTQRLPRLVGKGKALEMILTGAPIGAEEALRLGLVNSVVPSTELLAAADRLARVISAKSRPAIRLAMEAVQASAGHSLQEGQMKEAALFGKSCGTEDFHEGTRAFLEKRPPAFRST